MKCKYLNDIDCPILKNNVSDIHPCEGYSCDNPVYIYVVRCEDDSFYTGFTRNLEQRMKQHKTGKGSKWCKAHGFKNYTYIQCGNAGDGFRIERKIKKWGRDKKANLFKIYGTYDNI